MPTSLLQNNITVFGDNGTPAYTDTIAINNEDAVVAAYPIEFATGANNLTVPDGSVGLVITNISGTLKIPDTSGYSFGADTTFPVQLPASGATIPIFATAGASANLCWI